MAKTKEQKRHEAMLRAREALPSHRERWMKYQIDDEDYEKTKIHSPDHAEILRRQAQKTFEQAAERAGTDLYGNPL